MLSGFRSWEKDREKQINQEIDNEDQLNEEQEPEFDLYGTVLNEL